MLEYTLTRCIESSVLFFAAFSVLLNLPEVHFECKTLNAERYIALHCPNEPERTGAMYYSTTTPE